MEKVNLYFEVKDNKVIDITDMQNENFEHIEIETMNDFTDHAEDKGYEISDLIYDKLDDILSNNRSEEEGLFEYDLKTATSNRSYGELADMFSSEEIVVPDMQRRFVWQTTQCSRLIESILMGLPIPPLFFMELDDGKYEVIDGLQRLTTITNFIEGRPWAYGLNETKSNRPARLTGNVDNTIKGKAFKDLTTEQKRKIRRTTVTVIDFRQMNPQNNDAAKYLVFERINTGSEALNPMQIRKSLAHGKFMKDVYEYANRIKKLNELYTKNAISKELHVEAFLRTYVMSKIYYGSYTPKRHGIKNILDSYCEENKENSLDESYFRKFEEKLNNLSDLFENNIFKRVKNGKYTGNMSTSILEAMLGVLIQNSDIKVDKETERRYLEYMEVSGLDDPFLSSTGSSESILKRFEVCEKVILGK